VRQCYSRGSYAGTACNQKRNGRFFWRPMASKIPGLQWRVRAPYENMGSGKLVGLLRGSIEQLRLIRPVSNDTRVVQALRLLESINKQRRA
jgi:hypothetical protein